MCSVFILGLSAANYSPGNITLGDWLNVHDPRIDAEAQRVALEARAAWRQSEIENQARQWEADKVAVELAAVQEAKASLVWREWLWNFGLGAAGMLVVLGLAGAAATWARNKAGAIYPNAAGLYPVIVREAITGDVVVHDPNRALGPTTIYKVPSLRGAIAQRAGRMSA